MNLKKAVPCRKELPFAVIPLARTINAVAQHP